MRVKHAFEELDKLWGSCTVDASSFWEVDALDLEAKGKSNEDNQKCKFDVPHE